MGFIFPNNPGRYYFSHLPMRISNSRRKNTCSKSHSLWDSKSQRQDSNRGLFDSKVHLFVVSHSSLTSRLTEHGFFCELSKRRTGLPMCLSGGRGSASTPKVGQSHFGSLLWASMIVDKGAVSKSIQALRISASFPHHLGPRSKAWDGLEPGQSHLRTQAHIDVFPRCILL